MRPVAFEKERDVYKTVEVPNSAGGYLIKTKVHVGRETVRSATCPKPQHGTSTKFEGVIEAGWIFSCRGEPNMEGTGHRFIAEPPK